MADGEVIFVRGKKIGSMGEDCSSTTEDDIWDDTALIEAYDRAVSSAKEEVARRMGLGKGSLSGNDSSTSNTKQKHRKKKHKKKKEWQVRSACRAVYSKDGHVYEADIESIQHDTGMCVVKYIGYNNEEVVPLHQLQSSGGTMARMLQVKLAAQDTEVKENDFEMDYTEVETTKEPATRIKLGAFTKSSPNKKDWTVPGGRLPGRKGPYPTQFASTQMPSIGLPPMVVPPPPPPHLMARYPEEDTEGLSAMLMSWYMSGFHTGYYQGLRQCKSTHNTFRGNPSRKT